MKFVIPFIVLVNSHQRWKQKLNHVCFHLWFEWTLVLWCHSIVWKTWRNDKCNGIHEIYSIFVGKRGAHFKFQSTWQSNYYKAPKSIHSKLPQNTNCKIDETKLTYCSAIARRWLVIGNLLKLKISSTNWLSLSQLPTWGWQAVEHAAKYWAEHSLELLLE